MTHEITVSDEGLETIRDALDDMVSSNDIEDQDRALEAIEELPEDDGWL